MTQRLAILKRSLEKKQAEFDRRLAEHFTDVASANGQPLNDKRNGYATMQRWEQQNDVLHRLRESIEKTQRAIEREEYKISRVESEPIPDFIRAMVQSGELVQWRKYPNRFFVPGVEKARIVWDEQKQQILTSYISRIPTPEQFEQFQAVCRKLAEQQKAA